MIDNIDKIQTLLKYQYPNLNKIIAELRRSVGFDEELLAYMANDRDKCLSEQMIAVVAMSNKHSKSSLGEA